MKNLPEVGKTYRSAKYPGYLIQVDHLETQPDRFFIHATDKSSGANNQQILVWQEEWYHSEFRRYPDHP